MSPKETQDTPVPLPAKRAEGHGSAKGLTVEKPGGQGLISPQASPNSLHMWLLGCLHSGALALRVQPSLMYGISPQQGSGIAPQRRLGIPLVPLLGKA